MFVVFILIIILSFLDFSPDDLLLVQLGVYNNLALLNRGGVVPDIHPRLRHLGVVSFKPFPLPQLLCCDSFFSGFDLHWRTNMPLLLDQKELNFRFSYLSVSDDIDLIEQIIELVVFVLIFYHLIRVDNEHLGQLPVLRCLHIPIGLRYQVFHVFHLIQN